MRSSAARNCLSMMTLHRDNKEKKMPIGERQIRIDHLIKQAEKFSKLSAQDPITDSIDRIVTAIYLAGAANAERLEAIKESLDSVAENLKTVGGRENF